MLEAEIPMTVQENDQDKPLFPLSSCYYVIGTSSSWASLDLIIPIQESYPTTIIIIKPYPVITVVPDNIIGLGIVWLWD